MKTNPYEGLSEQAARLCIERMARTLAKKPRNPKTRAYIKSLVGETESPEHLWSRAKSTAQKIVERAAAHIETAPRIRRVRKDRVSPTANKTERRHPTKHCRRASRFQRNLSSATPREPRDMHEMNDLRARLNDAQGGLCAICGEKIVGKISLDHVIPHALLGKHRTGNYVAAHGECNGDKTNDVPTGCEMVWLLAVNAKLGLTPVVY